MSEKLQYAGFRLTERCNAGKACKDRCFSREGVILPDPPLSQILTTLDRIEGLVVDINNMGGEPTNREDLPQILRAEQERGFGRVMSTNALLLSEERLDEIVPLLDWLSLSVDADSQRVNDGLRGKGQWESARRVIGWFGKHKPTCRLKINTQVNAANLDHIDAIPATLFGNGIVTDWKLLQWTPRGDAAKVTDRYAVTGEVFAETVARMRKKYPGIVIVERAYPEPEPDTFIIRPDGTAEVNGELNTYRVVGNVLTEDPRGVIARAATIYSRFTETNRTEYHESYPSEGGSAA